MQKQKKRKFLGTVPKKWQLVETFWDCPEISNKKEERGITLIALIITIIVMIILVGVTVSVALNGGLFSTAKQAAEETQYQADYETLQVAVVAAMASEEGITQSSLQENLPSDWTVTGSGPFTVESPSRNVFTVEADGSITSQTGEETEDDDLAALKRYFLGENEEGKNILDLIDEESFEFKDDETTEEVDESTIEYLTFVWESYISEGDEELWIFIIKYNDKAYSVGTKVDYNYVSYTTTSVELKYTPSGDEGETYKYDVDGDGTEEECTILYDYGDSIEIVSPEVIGDDLRLGYNDSTISWTDEKVIEEADLNGDSSLSNVEKAIYSYNHAIETINDYVKEQVTTLNSSIEAENVRSVGSNPSDPYSENSTMYTSSRLETWEDGLYNGVGKSGDTNYEQDLIRMYYYGVADIGDKYWLASRLVTEYSSSVDFHVGYVNSGGFGGGTLWYVNSSGSAYGRNYSYGVRPIIKVFY